MFTLRLKKTGTKCLKIKKNNMNFYQSHKLSWLVKNCHEWLSIFMNCFESSGKIIKSDILLCILRNCNELCLFSNSHILSRICLELSWMFVICPKGVLNNLIWLILYSVFCYWKFFLCALFYMYFSKLPGILQMSKSYKNSLEKASDLGQRP